jgi:hypothetical protein
MTVSVSPVPTPNINIRPHHDLLYLVVLTTKSGPQVLCTAPNIETAAAVAMSNINWSYWQLYTTKNWTKAEMKDTNFNDLDFLYSLHKEKSGVSRLLQSQEKAIELRDTRAEAKLRTVWLDSLLCDCTMALRLSGENPMLVDFVDSISHELIKCDDTNKVYTNSILDYALIQEIDPCVAFAELSMHVSEINSARLRNYAIYMRFRNEMNSAPATVEAQKDVLDRARNFLLNNRLL